MDGFGGRPHWGKRHFQTAETLRAALPGVGPLRRRARAARPRGPLRQRVRAAGARPAGRRPQRGLSRLPRALPGPAPRRAGQGPTPVRERARAAVDQRRRASATALGRQQGAQARVDPARREAARERARSSPFGALATNHGPRHRAVRARARACTAPWRWSTSRSTTTCGRSSSGCARPARRFTSPTPRRAPSPRCRGCWSRHRPSAVLPARRRLVAGRRARLRRGRARDRRAGEGRRAARAAARGRARSGRAAPPPACCWGCGSPGCGRRCSAWW